MSETLEQGLIRVVGELEKLKTYKKEMADWSATDLLEDTLDLLHPLLEACGGAAAPKLPNGWKWIQVSVPESSLGPDFIDGRGMEIADAVKLVRLLRSARRQEGTERRASAAALAVR